LIETKCGSKLGLFLDQLKPNAYKSCMFNLTEGKTYRIRKDVTLKEVSRVSFNGHDDFLIATDGTVKVSTGLAFELPEGEMPNYVGKTYEIANIVLVSVGFGLKLLGNRNVSKGVHENFVGENYKEIGKSVFVQYHRKDVAKILGRGLDDDIVSKVIKAEWNYVSPDDKDFYTKLAKKSNKKHRAEKTKYKETGLGKKEVMKDKSQEKLDKGQKKNQGNEEEKIAEFNDPVARKKVQTESKQKNMFEFLGKK